MKTPFTYSLAHERNEPPPPTHQRAAIGDVCLRCRPRRLVCDGAAAGTAQGARHPRPPAVARVAAREFEAHVPPTTPILGCRTRCSGRTAAASKVTTSQGSPRSNLPRNPTCAPAPNRSSTHISSPQTAPSGRSTSPETRSTTAPIRSAATTARRRGAACRARREVGLPHPRLLLRDPVPHQREPPSRAAEAVEQQQPEQGLPLAIHPGRHCCVVRSVGERRGVAHAR